VEKEVLVRKIGLDESKADRILRVVNSIRNNDEHGMSISIRHSLMIAELVSLGASLKEAMIYSLHLSKDTLESTLLAVHVETQEFEGKEDEYILFLPQG